MQSITYRITVNDYVAFGVHQFFRTKPRPEHRGVRLLKGLVPCLLLSSLTYYLYGIGQIIPAWGLFVLTIICLYATWQTTFRYEQYLEAGIRKQMLQTYHQGNDERFTVQNTTTISEHGIDCDLGNRHYHFDWRAITTIGTTHQHSFLYYGPVEAIIIPRSAFSTDQDFQHFVQSIATYAQSQ